MIETKRLLLRELTDADVDGMFELDSDPKVHRYLGGNTIQSKDKTLEIIQFVQKQYLKNGIGRWAVIDKITHEFMGWTGLKLEDQPMNNHQNYYDLGFRLIPRYWGKGFATESAIASLKYGFETLKIEEVYGAADIENLASNKVLQKVGLNLVESFFYEDIPCNWYKLKNNAQ